MPSARIIFALHFWTYQLFCFVCYYRYIPFLQTLQTRLRLPVPRRTLTLSYTTTTTSSSSQTEVDSQTEVVTGPTILFCAAQHRVFAGDTHNHTQSGNSLRNKSSAWHEHRRLCFSQGRPWRKPGAPFQIHQTGRDEGRIKDDWAMENRKNDRKRQLRYVTIG